MYRQLYQFGGSPTGIQSLTMDYGRPLEVPQQQPLFTQTGNSAYSPVLNYGQTGLGQAGGTPLTMRSGGMSRSGYQEGGMGMTQFGAPQEEPIFPRLETLTENLGQAEQKLGTPSNNQFSISPMTSAFTGRMGYQEGNMAMMQPQESQGIMGAMPQEQGMPQEGGQEQTAILTIIQLLIEQGIPPEQARELAMQILQAFAQGGQPAVDEFANQLEQEEMGAQQFAQGGIAGYAYRKKYGIGSVFKSVGKVVNGAVNAVKSVAKSPIGQIALAIAAPYAIGALAPGFATLGGSGFMGAALRAGISNLAIQGITTGKFNPKQALLAAVGGGIAGEFFPQGGAPDVSQGTLNAGGAGIPGADIASTSTLSSGVTSAGSFPVRAAGDTFGSSIANETVGASGMTNVGPVTEAAKAYTNPTIMDKISQFGDTAKAGITNLYQDPIGTIGKYATSAYESVKDNSLPLTTGFLAGSSLAQQPNESDDEYASRAARDANVAAYITQYGRGSKLYSPTFYSMEKAVDPFAGRSTYAAMGGRIGYAYGNSVQEGIMSAPQISQTMGMPVGNPRQNQSGISELDYRKQGGFVPPIGIKEKADDIPAMLSNNEFVFTANAVRNAGGGNVNKGAQRMYGLMKQLEAGGRV
jgi:hypothetical protein